MGSKRPRGGCSGPKSLCCEDLLRCCVPRTHPVRPTLRREILFLIRSSPFHLRCKSSACRSMKRQGQFLSREWRDAKLVGRSNFLVGRITGGMRAPCGCGNAPAFAVIHITYGIIGYKEVVSRSTRAKGRTEECRVLGLARQLVGTRQPASRLAELRSEPVPSFGAQGATASHQIEGLQNQARKFRDLRRIPEWL
jgi:hypothetical protein